MHNTTTTTSSSSSSGNNNNGNGCEQHFLSISPFMQCQILFDIAMYFVQKGKKEAGKKSLSNPHSGAFNKAGHYLTAAFVRPIQERTKWLFRRTL